MIGLIVNMDQAADADISWDAWTDLDEQPLGDEDDLLKPQIRQSRFAFASDDLDLLDMPTVYEGSLPKEEEEDDR